VGVGIAVFFLALSSVDSNTLYLRILLAIESTFLRLSKLRQAVALFPVDGVTNHPSSGPVSSPPEPYKDLFQVHAWGLPAKTLQSPKLSPALLSFLSPPSRSVQHLFLMQVCRRDTSFIRRKIVRMMNPPSLRVSFPRAIRNMALGKRRRETLTRTPHPLPVLLLPPPP